MMFRERRWRADEVYAPNSQKLPRILFERAAKYLHRILNGETPRKHRRTMKTTRLTHTDIRPCFGVASRAQSKSQCGDIQ